MEEDDDNLENLEPPRLKERRSSYFEPKFHSTEQMFNIIQKKFFKSQEKINTIIYDTAIEASYDVASLIKNAIISKNKQGAPFVLGLATGSTPLNVYKKLIEYHEAGELSFKNCITFNLDEYYPIDQSSLQSYHRFMKENFFDFIDILPENIHIPDGSLPFSQVDKFCEDYENQIKAVGGIDIQLLGIGVTGHIGFNEPGSSFNSTTRLVYLDKITTIAAAGDFFGLENVPKKAISMGISTIFHAKKIILMAFSESKAKIAAKAIECQINENIPASFLQKHGKVQFFLDRPASSDLTRVKCPWIIKGINQQVILPFDDKLKLKAVLWLARTLDKSISKLTMEDFEQNGLIQLLEQTKNLKEFLEKTVNQLAKTFKTYPIGKEKKKVLIFSPHPDDDVICMGATMKKFCEQNHDVYVCYQTSGNLGVFDHDAIKFTQFASSFAQMLGLKDAAKINNIQNEVVETLKEKDIGEPDHDYVQKIKGMIRKTEATSAAMTCGIKQSNVIFLDLPFYQTGLVKKSAIQQIDIEKCKQLIEKIAPDYIFAAGDLTDPHGTHRNCLLAILKALDQLKNESSSNYILDLQVYLYRGAWQEWEIEEVDIAVPMTPDDLYQKRLAIYKHQSQKDKALFPGQDFREFWQRSEARNKQTAERYNQLGLIQYEAFEVFANLQGLTHLLKYELQ